jgi:AcrR family transcriptional regulator
MSGALPKALTGSDIGRRPLAREVVEEHQRRRVIEAAIPVFAKRGYPPTIVDQLVEASGAGVGSFYSLFEGKEGCMLLSFDQVVGDTRAELRTAAGTADAWPDRVCAVLRRLLDLVAERPMQARVALVEIQTAGTAALARYSGAIEEAAALLRRGRAEFPEATGSLAEGFELATVTGIAWVLHQRLVGGRAAETGSLFPELAELALEPYVGREAALATIAAAEAAAR